MPTDLILADSSAWVEFLRGTGSPIDHRVESMVRARTLVVTEPVLIELLAGARDREEWRDVRRMTSAFDFASVENPGDWIDAAALYRQMRGAGRTIRNIVDCLIAVVAMRIDAAVLHKDADFDAIAEVAPLKLA